LAEPVFIPAAPATDS